MMLQFALSFVVTYLAKFACMQVHILLFSVKSHDQYDPRSVDYGKPYGSVHITTMRRYNLCITQPLGIKLLAMQCFTLQCYCIVKSMIPIAWFQCVVALFARVD